MEEEATGKRREEKIPRNEEEPGRKMEMKEATRENSLRLRSSEERNAYRQLYIFTGFCCGGNLLPRDSTQVFFFFFLVK